MRYDQNYSLPSLKMENDFAATVRSGPNLALNIRNDTKAVLNNHVFTLDAVDVQNAEYADISNSTSVSTNRQLAGSDSFFREDWIWGITADIPIFWICRTDLKTFLGLTPPGID